MITYVVFYLFLITQFSKGENCDELGISMYQELRCTPVKGTTENCPSHYTNCEYKLPQDKCVFKKKEYDVGTEIPPIEDTGSSVGCFCNRQNATDRPKFTCAVSECGEYLGGRPLAKDCYRKYEIDKLCSVGEVCPPFENKSVCHDDGKEYRVGEKFYPKGTCKVCVCADNHDEKLNGPNCQDIFCGFELRHSADLENRCAPVYFYGDDKKALCCPLDFICHDGTEKIEKHNTAEKSDDGTEKIEKHNTAEKSDISCKYGPLVLQKGDYFTRSFDKYGGKKNLKCTCIMPPLVTCTAKF